MKHFFLTLTLLILTLLPASAVKKIQANPINIAISLVEKTDSAKIASTLTYYGYTHQATEDGYSVMTDPNGNEIRFSFSENSSNDKYPTVKVKASGTHKALDAKLKELDFEKTGNAYERMRNQYSKYKTRCSFGPHNTLILHRIAR